jgi:group I intron endonuclease
MKNTPGIYILEFPGGIYVGSSKHMRRRVLRHIADMRRGTHSNGFLQRVFDKHGEPTCRVERECDESELLIHEQEAIERLKPRFNLSPTAGRNVGHRHSADTINRMREASRLAWEKRPRVVGEEQKKKISDSLSGREFSAETRAKISAAKTGHVKSAETCAKISSSKKGKKINRNGRDT